MPENVGQFTFELEDYQQAARTYRSDYLRMPILALASALAFMTLRPGVRYQEVVESPDIDVELAPYKRNRITSGDPIMKQRVLSTFFGSLNYEFEPNKNISTLLGHRATQAMGESLATTIQAHEVLGMVPKAIGRKLLSALWNAVRDPNGNKTKDLFDGFDTITDKEIVAGNISTAKDNYLLLDEKPDFNNAVDIAQEIMYHLSPELRQTKCYMFTSQGFIDRYNKAYKRESGCVPYNTEYDKNVVEGSNGNLVMVPMIGKENSSFIHVTTRENMLVGCDQLSDNETVRVANYSPDTIMFMMRMFFGVDFATLDPRMFFCAEIPA